MVKTAILIASALLFAMTGCGNKPTNKEIENKLLQDYVCKETAKVNDLKILKTKETESTGGPHIFIYTVSGVIEWPNGCTEKATNTPPGSKEKFNRLVTLYKSDDGKWE
jgi:ABC-type uncharacterized transport system auxiliary subunit